MFSCRTASVRLLFLYYGLSVRIHKRHIIILDRARMQRCNIVDVIRDDIIMNIGIVRIGLLRLLTSNPSFRMIIEPILVFVNPILSDYTFKPDCIISVILTSQIMLAVIVINAPYIKDNVCKIKPTFVQLI